MADTSSPNPNIKPYLIIALLGGVVAYQSWKAGEALGDSFIFELGVLFALGGLLIALNGIRRAHANRHPALPAAPAEYNGHFAPDFRRNLTKLYEALGTGNPEMTLEEDYAFWYNQEHSIELVLTREGWMAFYLLTDGEYHMEAPLVQRAVADSPFASHPVAKELEQKYCDLPVSGIAWCTGDKMQVYPYTSTEDFTRLYAGNLFAPAEVFDTWLRSYLETGQMRDEE